MFRKIKTITTPPFPFFLTIRLILELGCTQLKVLKVRDPALGEMCTTIQKSVFVRGSFTHS
jgi:hypothetical protein